MATYHIKPTAKPDDKGVIVTAQNDAQALRMITEGMFTVENLKADQVAERMAQGVPLFKPHGGGNGGGQ